MMLLLGLEFRVALSSLSFVVSYSNFILEKNSTLSVQINETKRPNAWVKYYKTLNPKSLTTVLKNVRAILFRKGKNSTTAAAVTSH
jgi:hypothetical protein